MGAASAPLSNVSAQVYCQVAVSITSTAGHRSRKRSPCHGGSDSLDAVTTSVTPGSWQGPLDADSVDVRDESCHSTVDAAIRLLVSGAFLRAVQVPRYTGA